MPKERRFLALNLEVLKRSRVDPRAGDIFVLKIKGRDYYFGRVIDPTIRLLTEIGRQPSWHGILVYIYVCHSADKHDVPELSKDSLLLPPLIIEQACWAKGYVETVQFRPLAPGEVLPVHCFLDVAFGSRPDRYVNEHGAILAGKTEPCGFYGLTPFQGLHLKVSKALGLPLAADGSGLAN